MLRHEVICLLAGMPYLEWQKLAAFQQELRSSGMYPGRFAVRMMSRQKDWKSGSYLLAWLGKMYDCHRSPATRAFASVVWLPKPESYRAFNCMSAQRVKDHYAAKALHIPDFELPPVYLVGQMPNGFQPGDCKVIGSYEELEAALREIIAQIKAERPLEG